MRGKSIFTSLNGTTVPFCDDAVVEDHNDAAAERCGAVPALVFHMNEAVTSSVSGFANSRLLIARSVLTDCFFRTAVAYVTFVIMPVAGLCWLLRTGHALYPQTNAAAVKACSSIPASQMALRPSIFLTQIIIIIAAARLVGSGLKKLGQPRVVGEMLAGLVLGPSVLGAIAPGAHIWLVPHGTVRFLSALTEIGIVLFMFLIGLELDIKQIIRQRGESLVLSHASIAIPMFAGGAMALVFYHQLAPAGAPFGTFALFVGCAMSVTAFTSPAALPST